uniref:haptoglobin-like n=1 Tax=Pristiophorus japonicus TaxID=55135 RepID=UPI00398E926F
MWVALIQSIVLCCLVTSSVQHHEPDTSNVHCGDPQNITHGHIHYLTKADDDVYLDVIQYVCDDPIYTLMQSNASIYICTWNGKWANAVLGEQLPVCVKAHCEPPKTIDHGHFDYLTTPDEPNYLSVVKYTCDANYYEHHFSDEGVYVCTTEGKWRNTDMGEELPTCDKVTCGQPLEQFHEAQRVIGGISVVHGASPWSVVLKNLEGNFSNGVLINNHWVLSSFHAVDSNHTSEEIREGLRVYLGAEDSKDLNSAHEFHIQYIIYNKRMPGSLEYADDLALIKLKEEVVFGNHIMPVCLPEHSYTEVGQVGFVAGWFLSTAQSHLHYVALPVANTTECQQELEALHPHLLPEDFGDDFCTEHLQEGVGLCEGDTGAPFVVNDKGTFYVAGVASYDKACQNEKYDVYTDVFKSRAWIKTIIENH